MNTQRTALVALACTLGLTACGGARAAPEAPAPAPAPDPTYRGVPGFDTRTYPGEDVMTRWIQASPYRWVGYYLPAPCHTGTSWLGTRSDLRRLGWGIALLFVGEQDWPQAAPAAPDTSAAAAAGEGERCVRQNLTPAKGRQDGAAAASAARDEGFPRGSVVYLDVEPVETVSDSLAAYVGAWTRGLEAAGYAPGLYAHARNAERLLQVVRTASTGTAAVRLWLARPSGFNLRRAPAESGYDAAIWQGLLDTDETWGGTTLRIDVNVADRPDPSAPGTH